MTLFSNTSASLDRELPPSPEMKDKVTAMEKIVGHNFKNKRLLEEALTHPSVTNFPSYERLAVLGDAALGMAMSKHLFLLYPDMNQGNFTKLRSTNVSTMKFARAAVKHGFDHCLLRNSPALDIQVREFANAVSNEEDETDLLYGGTIQPNHALADIVESVAAAIYIDLEFDLDKLWKTYKHLLEPIVTLEDLPDHPVSKLFKLCQKHGKLVETKEARDDAKNISISYVYVDGNPFASASGKNISIAKRRAASEALSKLSEFGISYGSFEVVAENEAKKNLKELCEKKRIRKPTYRVVKEFGPAHEKRFVSSVEIETLDGVLYKTGDERPRKRYAENSAASLMIIMMNTKEAAKIKGGYFPSVLYKLWVMVRWVIRLLVFCFTGIILLVIFFAVVGSCLEYFFSG
ncbi:hypothetical protein C1H46_036336 [Malus baccata]|uniref:RNase III domain-containing protein n=1 Tax=Malus baccata TaxID=106549 RepID=A0A540KV82_MALBA|nr:hypothetical protein C1H46_036336 [Malus baccata]